MSKIKRDAATAPPPNQHHKDNEIQRGSSSIKYLQAKPLPPKADSSKSRSPYRSKKAVLPNNKTHCHLPFNKPSNDNY
jgi:hypothetical protein